MSKVKFQVARQYIEQGEYDKARDVLRALDHPSAKKWLDKLDELDPPFPEVVGIPQQRRSMPVQQQNQTEFTDKELRYLKRELERKRTGRIVGLFILGSFIACGSIPIVIGLFSTNFNRPMALLELVDSATGILCTLVIVVPLFIYLWNQEI